LPTKTNLRSTELGLRVEDRLMILRNRSAAVRKFLLFSIAGGKAEQRRDRCSSGFQEHDIAPLIAPDCLRPSGADAHGWMARWSAREDNASVPLDDSSDLSA
jgi:hypothetical protein